MLKLVCYAKENGVLFMKRINWVLVILVLVGFLIGGFIGSYFGDSWLNYGQTFGLMNPVELNMGILVVTFGLQIKLTIASVLGVLISLIVYRFVR